MTHPLSAVRPTTDSTAGPAATRATISFLLEVATAYGHRGHLALDVLR